MVTDYFNFYSIVVLTAIIAFSMFMVYFSWIMQYQDAGTTFPPTGATIDRPDDWTTDDQGWGVIPKINGQNTGLLHTDDPTYKKLVSSVPAVHAISDTTPPVYSDKPTQVQFKNGQVSIDFSKMDICARNKWAVLYKIKWDGVSNYVGKCGR